MATGSNEHDIAKGKSFWSKLISNIYNIKEQMDVCQQRKSNGLAKWILSFRSELICMEIGQMVNETKDVVLIFSLVLSSLFVPPSHRTAMLLFFAIRRNGNGGKHFLMYVRSVVIAAPKRVHLFQSNVRNEWRKTEFTSLLFFARSVVFGFI